MRTPLWAPSSVAGGLGEDGQVSEPPVSFPLILILIRSFQTRVKASLLIEAFVLLLQSIFFLFLPILQQRIQGAKHKSVLLVLHVVLIKF